MGTNECSQPASKSSWDSQDFGDVNMSSRPQWVDNRYLHVRHGVAVARNPPTIPHQGRGRLENVARRESNEYPGRKFCEIFAWDWLTSRTYALHEDTGY